jgi:hypothetical protein
MNSNDVQKPVDSAGPTHTGSNVNETTSDADAAKSIWPTQGVVDFANNFCPTSPKPTAFNAKEAQLMDQKLSVPGLDVEMFAMLLKDAANGMPGVTAEVGADWFMKYLDLQPAVLDIEVLDAFEQVVGKPRAEQCYSERGLQVGCIRALREAMDPQPRTQMPLATDASSKKCYKRRRADSGAENGLGSSRSDADAAIDIWATQAVVDFANNFGLTSPKPTAFNTKEAQLTDEICQKVKPASNRRDQGTSSHLNPTVCCASTAIEIFAMLLKDAANGMPGVTAEVGTDWFMKYLDLQPAVPDIEVLDAFEQIVGKPRAEQCYSERGLQVGCIRALREAMNLQPRTQMPLATDASSKRCKVTDASSKRPRIEHVTPVMDPEPPSKVYNHYSPINCTRQVEVTPESRKFLSVLLAPAPVHSGTAIEQTKKYGGELFYSPESTATDDFQGDFFDAVDTFFDPFAPLCTSGFGMAISGSCANHGYRPAVPRGLRAPQPSGFAVVNGVVLSVVNV